MNDLKAIIESTEKELAKATEKRGKANPKELAAIDSDIIRLRLRIQRLNESEQLLLEKEKGNLPTDILTRAKIHVLESLADASEQNKDINTDPDVSAALRASDQIDCLELLQMAHSINSPATLPDADTFTAQFESYITDKRKRIENAKKPVSDMDLEIERIQTALDDAMNAGNASEIIEYSDSLETAKKNRAYLIPALRQQEESDAFPPETFGPAWKEICDTYRHEFALRLEVIRTAQEIHDTACNELTELVNDLTAIRSSIQSLARENGSGENITQNNMQLIEGVDTEWLRLSTDKENNRVYSAIYRKRSELL